MNRYLLLFYFIFAFSFGYTQEIIKWDDKTKDNWPKETRIIDIPSTMDQSVQKCYIYESKKNRMPLIISLHTWGGNYEQRDPLLKYCIAADVNYIHPDFRGPNNNPNAAGSPLVVQDIDDVIQWAIDSMDINIDDIHIIGVSGGGFATVLSYMKTKHTIKSFHAFVGIYNLEDWYYESLARKNNYAKDILAITGSIDNKPNPLEVQKRSPLLMKTPISQRKKSKLHLYAGLHDGYTGSVPISHSLEMYNKVLKDFNPHDKKSAISEKDSYLLLKRRSLPNYNVQKNAFLGRDIIYHNHYKDLIELIIFDGGHEMPDENLLTRILGTP